MYPIDRGNVSIVKRKTRNVAVRDDGARGMRGVTPRTTVRRVAEYGDSNTHPSVGVHGGTGGLDVRRDSGVIPRPEPHLDEGVGALHGVESSARAVERLAVAVRNSGLDTATSVAIGCNVAIIGDGVTIESEINITAIARERSGGARQGALTRSSCGWRAERSSRWCGGSTGWARCRSCPPGCRPHRRQAS